MRVLKEVMNCISDLEHEEDAWPLSWWDTARITQYCVGYEAKEDTSVSFEKNGVKEWVPIVVTSYGKELSVKEMERCKKIVYFQNENDPQFS